jgi:hypothetical protein
MSEQFCQTEHHPDHCDDVDDHRAENQTEHTAQYVRFDRFDLGVKLQSDPIDLGFEAQLNFA